MTEETRPEKSTGPDPDHGPVPETEPRLPYLHMVAVGVLFLLLMYIRFEDPLPDLRTPLMVVLGAALAVGAFLLGSRTLKKN